jgi:hypothetical protein
MNHSSMGMPNTGGISGTPPVTPTKKSGCLKGCLIVTAVLSLLIFGATYFVISRSGGFIREQGSAFLEKLTQQLLSDATLPAEEKAQIQSIVQGFTAKVRAGEVSLGQGLKVAEILVQGPLIPYWAANTMKVTYLANSRLSDAEKKSGVIVINRFMNGVVKGTISKKEADAIFETVSEPTGKSDSETPRIKSQLSDDEIRSVLALMKTAADKANVQESSMELDLSDELARAIKAGMGS